MLEKGRIRRELNFSCVSFFFLFFFNTSPPKERESEGVNDMRGVLLLVLMVVPLRNEANLCRELLA